MRCRPNTHRSPVCDTGCSGAAGASSGSVRPPVRSASRSFSSRSPNPVSDKSKPPSFNSPSSERTGGLTDPDDAPAAPEHPVSQTGDLWVLGRHRILCGDSTVATDVERVLGGVEPHLMVTDPPYGVEYDAGWRAHAPITLRRTEGMRVRGE